MISRIWHGYTSFENANAYENLFKSEIFVHIKSREIDGYKGIQLLRREMEHEVEFITIMWFDCIESVKIFAGEDYEIAVVPKEAQLLLSRYDKKTQHYQVKKQDFAEIK